MYYNAICQVLHGCVLKFGLYVCVGVLCWCVYLEIFGFIISIYIYVLYVTRFSLSKLFIVDFLFKLINSQYDTYALRSYNYNTGGALNS